MSVKDLLAVEQDGSLRFGDYTLDEKTKVEDFKYEGDLLKCKSYKPMTKLERNGMFVYESVPGTSVDHFVEDEKGVTFSVNGAGDAQITVGLEEEVEYEVIIAGVSEGRMKTGLGGKLSFNAELGGPEAVKVQIKKA